MILSELKRYLVRHRRAAIGDLATRFDADPAAIRGMLDVWIRKGRVRRLESEAGDCGGCNKCDAFDFEIYEWRG
jgi:hypothetical protein